MDALIIGAGIGGLSLALMLEQRGIDVRVVETSREIRPLGVGINLQPSAIAELAMLDLLAKLDANAVRTAEVSYFNRYGQHIWTEPRGLDAGYAVPQFSIHRGRLQMLLLDAFRERIGADALRCAVEALSVDPATGTVRLRNHDDGREFDEVADVVVAADGIHSTVRRQFYPNEGRPKFSGSILWRGTSFDRPFLSGRTMAMAGHADQKFVAYPIRMPQADGRALIHWVAELKRHDALPPKNDWNRQVSKEVFASAFDDWRFDWLDVPGLIDKAERVFEFPMVDRDPLPRWSYGRVTLLGDAAHPMYPIGSNGATQAVLDARALADALDDAMVRGNGVEADIVSALVAYEAERLPRTAQIVFANRGQGPDHVMQLAEERAPQGFANIHDVVSNDELARVAALYKALVGLEIGVVNARYGAWRARA